MRIAILLVVSCFFFAFSHVAVAAEDEVKKELDDAADNVEKLTTKVETLKPKAAAAETEKARADRLERELADLKAGKNTASPQADARPEGGNVVSVTPMPNVVNVEQHGPFPEFLVRQVQEVPVTSGTQPNNPAAESIHWDGQKYLIYHPTPLPGRAAGWTPIVPGDTRWRFASAGCVGPGVRQKMMEVRRGELVRWEFAEKIYRNPATGELETRLANK